MVNERVVWTVGVGIWVGGATRVGGSVLVAGDGRGRTSGVLVDTEDVWGGGARNSEIAWLSGWKDAPSRTATITRKTMARKRAIAVLGSHEP